MRTAFLIGGPLVAALGFVLYSDVITFGDQHPGIIHFGGVEPGGTFSLVHEEVYQCDENGNNCVLIEEHTEFTEVGGLELEQAPIEYRTGAEDTTMTKQPGLKKYTNITMRRPTGFDWSNWKFVFDDTGVPPQNMETEPDPVLD